MVPSLPPRPVAVVVLLLAALAASPAAGAVTPQEVNAAIARGRDWLYKAQSRDGTWEENPKPDPMSEPHGTRCAQWTGTTALATYALLASGERSQELQRLSRAIDFLKATKPEGNYALAFRCMVWMHLTPSAEVRALALQDARAIGRCQLPNGLANYWTRTPAHGGDMSNSQVSALGLWAAQQVGVEVPTRTWMNIEQCWRAAQQPSGAWPYKPGGPGGFNAPHPGMTPAGVATLLLVQEGGRAARGDCNGNAHDPHLDRARQWLGQNFAACLKPNPMGARVIYGLYALERCGVAAGFKYFGPHDWYQLGADWLLKNQRPDGAWATSDGPVTIRGIADTAFAILFLAYGRAPVVMNKLEYAIETAGDKPKPANWNQRPRDAAYVTRWIGKQTERLLNWQITNLSAPVDELLEAPILYLAGNQELVFTEPQRQKLRSYVEQGGLILGNADCASAPFAKSFRKLGADLFGAYEFRELPADHPIYTRQQFPRSRWKSPPSVLGLSNGARELMVLIPSADVSRAWQLQQYAGKEDTHELMSNLFLYSVERANLRYKGETHVIRPDDKVKTTAKVTVARLQYNGNWDPEPAAWRRQAIHLRNKHALDLSVQTVKLGDGKLDGSCKLAHLTGTHALKLDDAAKSDLRKYVEGGGILLVDAAGGSADFANSAEQELVGALPGGKLASLPLQHPVYAGPQKLIDPAGESSIAYRLFAVRLLGHSRQPRLKGIEVAGRTAVFYSAEDLTVGMVGQPIDGIHGYAPHVAQALVSNMVMAK